MPTVCVVMGCNNTFKTHKMFWFPHAMKEPEKRKMWIKNVSRKDWFPGETSYVCSKHFVDGKPTEINPYPTLEMEMPNRCVVAGCRNTNKTHKMFWFPHAMKEPEKREMWIKNVNRKDWVPGDSSYLCSKHFVDGIPTETNPHPTLEMGGNCTLKKGPRPPLDRNKLSMKSVDNNACTSVDALPPRRRRRRRKQLNEIVGSTVATSSRQQPYKNTNIAQLLDDVSSIDDVLLTWQAKMELQLACGFSASENMPVDLVVLEAVRRIENLFLELSRVRNTTLQLLHKQRSLIIYLITPSAAYLPSDYHYNENARIQKRYDDDEATAAQSQNSNSG